jgi:hypothetical protein
MWQSENAGTSELNVLGASAMPQNHNGSSPIAQNDLPGFENHAAVPANSFDRTTLSVKLSVRFRQ